MKIYEIEIDASFEPFTMSLNLHKFIVGKWVTIDQIGMESRMKLIIRRIYLA